MTYGLSIDRAKAYVTDQVLADYDSTSMVILDPRSAPLAAPTSEPAGEVDAHILYDDNTKRSIIRGEARAYGIVPVRRGNPAYQYMRDADRDGVVCE